MRGPQRGRDQLFVIVVASDQSLLTVQLFQNGERLVRRRKGEVAQEPDRIGWLHAAIPVPDQRRVHRLGIGKRPVAVLEYVAMPKVRIGRQKYRHGYLPRSLMMASRAFGFSFKSK